MENSHARERKLNENDLDAASNELEEVDDRRGASILPLRLPFVGGDGSSDC